jgi:protein-disulfide isomerase
MAVTGHLPTAIAPPGLSLFGAARRGAVCALPLRDHLEDPLSQKKAIIGVVIAAVVIAIVIIVVQQASNSGNSDSTYAKKFTADYPAVEKMLTGIPQKGQTLGLPGAPVTITEYMDYKCPVCGAASSNLVPGLISTYVRPGTVKMVLNPVHIIQGNQSETAALAGLGIVPQNKMWQFSELILRNQGSEVDPWLTNGVLTDAATTVGADIAAWNTARASDAAGVAFINIANQFAADTSAAGAQEATPTFLIKGPKGSTLVQGDVPQSQIAAAINKVNG